jgi:hypothetical protein
MGTLTRKPLQRLRYWQGQALLSADFRDQTRLDARRREMHNRALHDLPGVAAWLQNGEFGLEVTPHADGKPGFTVNCGVAYDCAGRLLLLQQPRDVGPPVNSAKLILQARRAASAASCGCPPAETACRLTNAGALENDVELSWEAMDSLAPIHGVLLARVTVDGESIKLDPAFPPRVARPLARPRLARGETVRGNTPWERWEIDEPDGQGGLKKRVVGVQTHIDTSAAGFTATPNYFATLLSPGWDLGKSEFAPAFFPQVAESSVDGFTFRLLMIETARRRYSLLTGTARITATRRVSGDRLQMEVDSTTAFRQNDAVAVLRPRGDLAFRIQAVEDTTVTLESPLPASVTPPALLAVGCAPRIAKVISVKAGDPTVLVSADSTVAIKKNDVLVRLTDNAVTIVNAARAKSLTVKQPFPNWKKEEAVGFALRSAAVVVKDTQNDNTKTTIVTTKAHQITLISTVVGLDEKKRPTGAVADVTPADEHTLEIKPPLTDAALAAIKQLSLVRKDVTIHDIQSQNAGVVVEVNDAGPFAEGDFVAGLNDLSAITTIEKVDADNNELSLTDSIAIPAQGMIAAATWIGATTVDSPAVAGATAQIIVGRAGAVPESSFVVREEGDSFSTPYPVKSVAGTLVTLAKPFDGLNRLDTLAIGVFPRIVTVIGTEGGIRVAEAGVLKAGDVLIPLGPGAGPLPLSEVVSAIGDTAQLRPPMTNVTAGVTQLGVVHFFDTAELSDVPGGLPFKVTLDGELEGRQGDFVAVLTHYVDNSSAGIIAKIQGTTITLAGPGIAGGDGIVRQDWIDGGILGMAAVSPFIQPLVRLETIDGLAQAPRQATAVGYDLVTHRFTSFPVRLFVTEPALNRVYVWPASFGMFQYRPETLVLITTFNTDFPSAFATFAQKQDLAVCWIGCQQEFPKPSGCPGTFPATSCCGSSEE